MSKFDLKTALESLEVKKPLRLQKAGPVFQSPTQSSAPTLVSGVTRVTEVTKVTGVTKVESTQVGARDVSVQGSSVALENETAGKLGQGYTRIPNRLLMWLVGGRLTRSEMQILLLIARFTISFQRRHAPLSKASITRQTDLSGPAVVDAIGGLIEKGLVEKIPGNQLCPNKLGLVFSDEWDFFSDGSEDESKRPETPNERPLVTGVTKVSTVTRASPVTQVGTVNQTLVSTVTKALLSTVNHIKDTQQYSNKLSLSEYPKILQRYFSELKPQKKRESEIAAFEELLGDYSAEDISACFEIVREQGVGPEKAPCHSPMAYLSKAIGGVMAEVIERRKKTQERLERETREADAARKQAEIDEKEAADWAAKEAAFLKAFPDQGARLAKIQELIQGRGFRPDSEIGMRMAIGKWAGSCIDAKELLNICQ